MRFVDIALLILSASLGLFLAVFIVRNRKAPGSQALSVLILGASIWSLGYAFELLASSLTYKLFWEQIRIFWDRDHPPGVVHLCSPISGISQMDEARPTAPVPVGDHPGGDSAAWCGPMTCTTWYGNRWNWSQLGPLVMLDFTRGPWFWVLMIFSYTAVIDGIGQAGDKLIQYRPLAALAGITGTYWRSCSPGSVISFTLPGSAPNIFWIGLHSYSCYPAYYFRSAYSASNWSISCQLLRRRYLPG